MIGSLLPSCVLRSHTVVNLIRCGSGITGSCFEYGFNLDQGPTRLVSNSALHKLSKVKATREQGEFQLKKKKKKNEGNMNIYFQRHSSFKTKFPSTKLATPVIKPLMANLFLESFKLFLK